MSKNLFIAYDLNTPGQDYEAVIYRIKTLGTWAKVQKSLFYVNTDMNYKDAADFVYKAMDSNDSLIVIDTVSNNSYCYGVHNDALKHMQRHWAV